MPANYAQLLFDALKKSGSPQARSYARPLVTNQYGPSFRQIGKGSLVSFNYMFFKNDPYPLVLLTDVWQNYLRGINLHYLTFPYVKNLLQPNCDNIGFSYINIKADNYIVNAFRQYKRIGIRQIKRLDCAFLLNVLAMVRSLDPNEIEAIRRVVREQIQKLVNPTAEELAER